MPAPGYRSREWKRKNRPKGGLSGIFDAVQDAVSSASSAASSAAQQAASSGRSVTNASPAERAARRRQASRQRQAKRRREARRRQQRASAPSVAESLADLGRTRAERLTAQNLARYSQGEAAVDYRTPGWTGETTKEMLSQVSGRERQKTRLERAQRRVRQTKREADSVWKGPGKLAKRVETPQEFRQDQIRYNNARLRRRRLNKRTKVKRRITNTAVEVAENILSEPQGQKQLPQIKRALRTNRGRTLLVANWLQGDSEAVASEGQATRFTGVVDPFTRANQASNRAKGGTELLRRKAQQIKVLENQINQRLQAGDQNGARRTYERYQRQVRQYRQTAKRINRAANRSEEQLIRTTRQIAAGKFPGTFKMKGKGADSSIELPSETLQKDQIKNTVEEGFGLGLSPADAGLAVATGFVGRGVLGGAKAAVVGTKLAKEADSGTKLVPAVIAGLQSTNTNTGRIGGAVLRFMSGKGGRRLYRASVAGTGLAAIAGRDYAVPFIEGAADAVSTPSKGYNTIQTTFRNALGTVAALPTLGANLAATVKRAGAAPFVENEYQREVEYITAPAVQLADSMWMELEQMWDVYTSKNPEMISKATQEDYGIGPVFSAYYLLRPFTKGIRRAVGKSGDLVTLPAFGTTNTLADRIAGDRGNVKGVRLTTLPAREAAYEAGEKVAAMVEKMPDYVSNALPFTIGFRNPFSQPDMTPMRGRETLREIGSRRRASSMVFLAKSRAEAMESTMNSQAVRPARIAIQWYNSRKMSPSDRSAYNSLEEAVDAANSAIEDSHRAVMPTVEPPKRFTLPDLVNELVSRGLHADRDGNITIDYAMIRALADGQPEGSVSKQRLEAILALPRIFDPESKERAMVVRIAIGLDRSYQILNAYRRQGIIEEFGEDTPEARAKLDADRNAAALETAIAYEQMTGIPAPSRPEVSIAALMEERREILADENKDLDTKRKDLERVTSQMREAVRALYNRDLQDRARIRATGVRGRLTQAGKEARKYGIRTRVNEATEWLLVSGGYRQAIGQRLREIANELQSLEARRRARDRRVGELKAREQEEGRRRRKGEPELADTRAKAEQVMRDQIDGESEDQILIAALRAERRELEQQREDIARHERQMRRDKKLFERANRKVERLTKELESKVSESLRVKADDLREERAELADEITTQAESLVMFSREMRAALDKEELDAIQRRVEEEIIAEYGPDLDDNGARQVHRRAKERKQARIDSINRRLESHTPLTQRQLGEVLGRIDTLTDEVTDAKAELALVLMALREGANRDTAAREFDAIQEGRPERPSGTRYRPGEMGADTIEGRSQVVNDLLERINRLEAEKERLSERVANHDVEIPPQIRRDLESSRADLIKEVGAHADEINRLTLRIIPPERVAKIRKAKTRAAVGVAVETKKREVLADDVAARQAIFDQYVEEAYEAGLGQAHYLAHIEPPDPAAPDRTGPSVDAALRTPYEKFRTGELARAGGADRSVKTLFSSIAAEARRQSRQRTTQALMSQAYREVDAEGNQKTEYTQEEARVLIEEGKVDGAKFTWLPITMLHDQRQFGPMIDALVNDGASRGKIDAYVKEQLPELEAEEMRLPSGKQRLEEKFLAEGQGVRGVLVPNQSIKIVVDSERKLKGVERILYEFNKVSSRLVLGTSISWMLAQPIAEFLILIMDQSNPARLLRAAKRVKTLRKSEEGRRALALLSGSTYGAARDLRASTRLQQDYNRAVKELNDMPITSIVKEAVRLETLGRVDRWKGAWIREIGAAAELDREQSSLRRAAKAFIGNKDAIEEASAKLAKMSPEEQILWTGTKEGMAVANQIAKNIDDMLGNWTDVKPGFETGAGSLVFFYPFVRFSLRWTFYTYPKRHPIRAALAQIYGALNAEMLEEWMDFDPAWVSDWAAAPVFGGTDEERIVSLVGLNRVSPSGNAFIEYGALSDNPFFTLTKVAPPWLGMIGRAAFGRDPYGAPLVDPDSVFGNVELPGLRTITNQLLDETANLIAPLRSIIRYTGFKPSEVLAKGDMPWDLLGDVPGMTTEGKGLLAAKGADEQNDRYQGQLELPAPGDDENFIRDLIRREVFALLPKPAHYYKTEQRVNSLFEKRTAAQKDAEYPYPDVMYRGQLQSLSEAVEKVEREKREAMETVDGMSSGWRPTSQQKAYLSRAEKIKEIRDNGERVKENVETSIQNTYREAGLTMGLENKIRRSVLSRKRQETATLRREWEESVSGEWWAPKEYPGDRQARIDLREIKEIQDTEDGMSAITGPVNTRGTFVSEGQATPRRRKLVETLRAGTRSRLERAGMRRVDLTDPNLDPSTTTRKTKDGNVVVRYRGKPVLGQVPLAAVRQAEQNNTLDVDEDGRLTIPQTRRAVTAVEQSSERVFKQKQKVQQLLARTAPKITSDSLNPDQERFARMLTKQTGLSAEVVGAWLVAEHGGPPGDEYSARGYYNFLNIGPHSTDPAFNNLNTAVKATADLINESGYYGGIRAAKGKGPEAEAQAILSSPWGTEQIPLGSVTVTPGGGKEARQALKAAQNQLSNIEKQFQDVAKMARNMGINVNEPGQVGPITYPDKQAKQLNGAWAGTERLLDMANGGDFPISSEKRDYNTVANGMSDHYVGATGSFAHDLPTTDDAEAERMMRQYYNRLKLNEPLEWGPGVYKYYTSRKYPGYVFQMLWKSDGDHYDHVHIGAKWTGDDLPGGTFYGAGPGSSVPSSGGVTVGGGGAAAGGGAGGSGGGQMLWQDADGQRLSLAESQSDMEPIYAAEQIAELSDGEDGQVKSAQNAIAGLPSVKARKKKSLRFDPSTRI